VADEKSDSRGEARQAFFAKQQLIDSCRAAFQLMSAVLKNVTLYPESHPIMLTGAEKLLNKIAELLVGRKEAAFYLVGGELFFEKTSIPVDQSLTLALEQFTNRDLGGIVFKPGLTADDLLRFGSVMSKEASYFTGAADPNTVLAQEEIRHIELHRVLLVDKDAGGAIKAGKRRASEIFRETVETMKELVTAVQTDKASNVRKMNSIVQTMVDNVLENRDAYLGLTNLKMYDEYTFAHSVNVSILAVSLGTFLSFQKAQIAALGLAGLMHDIGKVNVAHGIINKPDRRFQAGHGRRLRTPPARRRPGIPPAGRGASPASLFTDRFAGRRLRGHHRVPCLLQRANAAGPGGPDTAEEARVSLQRCAGERLCQNDRHIPDRHRCQDGYGRNGRRCAPNGRPHAAPGAAPDQVRRIGKKRTAGQPSRDRRRSV